MKTLLLYIFLLISGLTAAQNAVAELKFEEAEIAFNKQDFKLTIEKVNEFEKVLGGVTDKSLYLRIISQKNLFNPSNYYADDEQYNLFISLDNNIKKYLKATEKNGLDDKFKDVYAEGEKLKKLNLIKDKKAWLKEKKRIEDEAETRRLQQLAANEQCKNNFMAYTLDDLPIGLSLEEFKAQYPQIIPEKLKIAELPGISSGSPVYIHYPKSINFEDKRNFVLPYNATTGKPIYDNNIYAVLVQDNKVVGYQKQIAYFNSNGQGDLSFNSASSELNKHVQYYKSLVENCSNDVAYKSITGLDTWTLDNKVLSLFQDVYQDEKGRRWRMSLTVRILKTL